MYTRALLLSKPTFSRLHSPLNPIFPSSSSVIATFFSSKPDFPPLNPIHLQTNPTPIHPPDNDDVSLGLADTSTQELKKRISKYMEGDMEILPSIFETILERKLSGKHNDTDDELMEELRSKMPHTSENEDHLTSDDEFDMDEDSDEDSD